MKSISLAEKTLITVATLALISSIYVLGNDGFWDQRKSIRREMPIGKIQLSRGDTRWKGQSQVHHFGTWLDQRLYEGDSLYAGPGSRLAFYLGEIHFDLKPHTRVTLQPIAEKINLEASFGEFEIHLPPGARLRLSAGEKYMDLASVNGGRVNAWVGDDRLIKVQNIAGDLVVRTHSRAEYTVTEEEFFSAQAR